MGTIIAVDAVLLNHIDKNPVMPMKVSSSDLGRRKTIVSTIIFSRTVFCVISAQGPFEISIKSLPLFVSILLLIF